MKNTGSTHVARLCEESPKIAAKVFCYMLQKVRFGKGLTIAVDTRNSCDL